MYLHANVNFIWMTAIDVFKEPAMFNEQNCLGSTLFCPVCREKNADKSLHSG